MFGALTAAAGTLLVLGVTSVALAGIATVMFTLAMALTLIPALLGAVGGKLGAARREDASDGFFGRSARKIQRRPVLAAVGVIAVLAACALPFLYASYLQGDPRLCRYTVQYLVQALRVHRPGWRFRGTSAKLRIFDMMSGVFYLVCVKGFLHDRGEGAVSYEEKGTWVYLVTSAGAYAVYLVIIVGRLASTPAAEVPYVAVLLWTAGASIIANTVGRVLVETASPSDSRRADVRDRDVSRFGEHASRWFLVAGAAAGLVMAMAKADYFWIANVIYLGFVLWALAGSVLKLVAYRRGM